MDQDPFSAASASAMTDLSSVQAPAINSDPLTPTETPVAEAVPAQAPTPEAGTETPTSEATPEPTAAEIQQAERELELIWRGQRMKFPESQVISLAQKGQDYSQKTAELAQIRRDVEAQKAALDQQANDLRQVLSDPQQMRQLLEITAQQQGTQLDPQGGVTVQQAEQLIAANVQRLQGQVQSEIKRAQLELETNRLEQEYTSTIGGHIQQLSQKFPVLQDVEGVESLLKQEALAWQRAQLEVNPNREISVQDILGVMSKAAERRAQKIEARFTNKLKQIAVQQQTVKAGGIEAGGSAPTPQAETQHKLNSKALREQVLRDLGAI